MKAIGIRSFMVFALFVFASALASCGDFEPETREGTATEAILGGTPTTARPEVGWIGNCTATLISSRYFITAAHCIGYQARAQFRTFRITLDPPPAPPANPRRSFDVNAIYSFDGDPSDPNDNNGVGTYDIAVGRLEEDVPNDVAMPASIANRNPVAGETVTSIGFGCNQTDPLSGIGTKRFITHEYPSIGRGCEGDSGGPIFAGNLAQRGRLLGVISSSSSAALPASLKLRIEALMRSLDDGTLEPLEQNTDRPGGNLRPMPSFAVTAAECRSECAARPDCRAFSFVPNQDCWLKSSVTPATARTGVTSGVMVRGLEPGYQRLGPDSETVTAASVTECRDKCSKREDCHAFTFILGHCHVFPRVYEAGRDSRLFSGLSLTQSAFYLEGSRVPGGLFSAPSPDACEAWCARSSGCVAYAWTPPSVCELRNAVSESTACEDCRSGIMKSLELETDRPGADLPNMPISPVASAADCQLRCVQHNDCRAFTWVIASRNCWLKGFVASPAPSVGMVSGIRRGIEVNVDRPGGDFAVSALINPFPEECQRQCEAVSRCDSWSFVTKPSGIGGGFNVCRLKDDFPDAVPSVAVFSGRKGMFRF
jgi:PAN domain/Trypsin